MPEKSLTQQYTVLQNALLFLASKYQQYYSHEYVMMLSVPKLSLSLSLSPLSLSRSLKINQTGAKISHFFFSSFELIL